ncbi:hypothetical protein Q73A0000_08180 [Kaistella flava (ex Peng et al. 2021)]|uniref:Uncharacterized protein n=1 Tax=Kaistella flava (ex Peng et al. 2021) TaxID=2038776 RepID=A0A7M2Y9S8_9FLAO|nr:hypothetical protein [Kaistella flava (ex Peng et al. 2021)]QOW10344.1 hypothetical protein Q73A0000_08180 [Kaistella flava (ex Peng et al. 2021)]
MKNLIILCCLMVVGVYFYYPVFDSKGISYIIVFSSFVIVCFAGAKLYSSDEKGDYDSLEKKMDKLHDFDGMFQYMHDGFYIKKGKSMELIKWSEIITVNSLRIPVLNDEQTGIEIITENKKYEFIDQQTPGIEKLIDKLYENLPSLEEPNSEINHLKFQKTRLYELEKSVS